MGSSFDFEKFIRDILEKEGFEYSQGKKSEQCVDEVIIDSIARELGLMVSLKKYQMHNSEEYYKYWNRYFFKDTINPNSLAIESIITSSTHCSLFFP